MAFVSSLIDEDRFECLLLWLLLEYFHDILRLKLLSPINRIGHVLCHSERLESIVGEVGRESLELPPVI